MTARAARKVRPTSAPGTAAGGGVLWMAARAVRKARPTTASGTAAGKDVQPALIGRHYVSERDSAPVQYNGIL